MQLLQIIKEFSIGFVQGLNTDLWLEITTNRPRCIYYFGPFNTYGEAETACPGYVEDIASEGSQGIEITLKRCQPEVLTVFDE